MVLLLSWASPPEWLTSAHFSVPTLGPIQSSPLELLNDLFSADLIMTSLLSNRVARSPPAGV